MATKTQRQPLTEDGYLRTGDIGYTESDTTFTYLQRAGDTLCLGGFLVSPQEIEDAVMQAPGVADAQVVAVGTSAGARPVAFIIPSDDVPTSERLSRRSSNNYPSLRRRLEF